MDVPSQSEFASRVFQPGEVAKGDDQRESWNVFVEAYKAGVRVLRDGAKQFCQARD